MNRRRFLLGLGAIGATGIAHAAYQHWPDAGISNPCLSGLPADIQQHPLMRTIWQDIDATQVWDSHVHLVGTGDSDSGIWFNPQMDSLRHPILKLQKHFYMNGACADSEAIDTSVVTRMVGLHQDMPAGVKSMLFAFDWARDAHGTIQKDHAIFHIPNDYAANIAKQYPEHFEWVASIHPYRPDAVDALVQAKAQGARAIKWLPSSMGIDPASAKCDAFYQKAADLHLPIITHGGAEKAVQGGNQAHGNPLRVRRALDHGVRVVIAHCASEGHDEDYDNQNKPIKSIELFTRLMEDPQYEGLLFGEISALTLVNHAWAIPQILGRTDWHKRLLNGSDYPLPGIFPFINTRQLAHAGLLQADEADFLRSIKPYNALLYDFALKRLLRFEGKRFDHTVFETRSFFEPTTHA